MLRSDYDDSMEPNLIAEATEISAALGDSPDGPSLVAAAQRLNRLLASVPDFPAGTFSEAEVARLASLSDDVIERIETRVASEGDSAADQQRLVEAVYVIRRALEEIDHWRRHYLPNHEGT